MEKETIMVTVAMVTYNSEKYLPMAIGSVLTSTYPNFELIICDDNSTDESWKIINSYNDPRIVKIKNEHNLGEYKNRNKCIDLAKGEYLIFIDGDDILYEHGLDYLVSQLKGHEKIGMVLGLEWKEQIIFPCKISPVDFYRSIFFSKNSLLALNFTKILFNRRALREAGGLSIDFKTGDTYVQGKIGMKYDVLLVSEGFSWWRRRPEQASEKILKDGTAAAEGFKYFYEFLLSDECPLKGSEFEDGIRNHLGNYSRILLRFLGRGQVTDFMRLVRMSDFPIEGWKYLGKPSKRNINISNV